MKNLYLNLGCEYRSVLLLCSVQAALNMVTVCAAEEMKKEKILFCLLHPGWVRTDTGGQWAEIDVKVSVKGMLKVMATMAEKHNGHFLDYHGTTLPW
ncbi:C-signal-like [Festucalex cinctus]